MLEENSEIIDFWNQASKRDALRETVSQWEGETNEQYFKRWAQEGQYAARKILSVSKPRPVALEIGPGMGRVTRPMSAECESILALDISPEMVCLAEEKLADLKNLRVQVIGDEDLSFLPEANFDLAYSIACFQHAPKKSFYRYLRGIRMALKPGGVLFFGVLNLCSDRGWEHFEAIINNDYPQFFHTPQEIECYLTHAGYGSHELSYEGETLWGTARR